jgi:predicted nucleotidyltransferase
MPPMVEMEQIEELARRIGREFQPDKVVLFGSYAHGAATDDSDVDLLVIIAHNGKGWRLAGRIRSRVRPGFPVDVLVRSPSQIRRRLDLGDCFAREVIENGKVLYESTDA